MSINGTRDMSLEIMNFITLFYKVVSSTLEISLLYVSINDKIPNSLPLSKTSMGVRRREQGAEFV